MNDEWGDPIDFYHGFIRELNLILISLDIEPITDDVPSAEAVAEEKVEELDEFGEPIVRSSRNYAKSRSEKLKNMKICIINEKDV